MPSVPRRFFHRDKVQGPRIDFESRIITKDHLEILRKQSMARRIEGRLTKILGTQLTIKENKDEEQA